MKAAVIHGPRDVRVETVDVPSIQDDEVLVKVKACGICGTDLHVYKTGETSGNKILGHEWSGEVADIGSDVKGLTIGERVAGVGYRLSGWYVKVPGEGLDGAFAEYVVVPNPLIGDSFFRIPDDMSWELAATIEPVSIACYVVDQAQVKPEDTVVVLGTGMIGLCIVQICKDMEVSHILVSEPSDKRRTMAETLGADVTFNPLREDPVEAIERATKGWRTNVVFECSGMPDAVYQAMQVTRFYGRVMQVGFFEKDINLSIELMNRLMTYKNLTWQGCGGQGWDMAREMVRTGKVNTKDLITHEYPLAHIEEAFETQLKADESIKVLVKP